VTNGSLPARRQLASNATSAAASAPARAFPSARADRRRLFEHVMHAIEQRILSGELRPNDPLPTERELAQQFNVSRTAVREAIKALEQAGLVTVRHGRGVAVATASHERVADSIARFLRVENSPMWALMELRSILETEIAALAAQRRTTDDLARLTALVDRMDQLVGAPTEYVESDLEFHRALVASAHNPLFDVVLDPFRSELRHSRDIGATVPNAPTRSIVIHRRILEAVRSADATQARREMNNHFHQLVDFLREAGALADGSPPHLSANDG
jgi:GntR family transcriptional regulator, transcriptional repressor for pyruvate dehydrogenase complex